MRFINFLKVLCFQADLGGCYIYRIKLPFDELKRYDVEITSAPFIPNRPGTPQFNYLVELMEPYDLVILQRCYLLNIAQQVHTVTKFLGIPLVFETDDDYLHLEPDNPAYYSIIPMEILESKPSMKELEVHRLQALEGYKQILNMADAVTVTTEELKHTILPYNKNVYVLPNNVVRTYEFRTYDPEHVFVENGKIPVANFTRPDNTTIKEIHGMYSIPSHYVDMKTKQLMGTPRIGYSGTQSHRGQDFDTIEHHWYKLIDKCSESCWFLYIGDKFFYDKHDLHVKSRKNVRMKNVWIPPSQYDLYMFHLRNLDIGIAPLAPNIFNMSKSDIKAVELASWGIPCVLPNYITYTRNFKHGETCLTYNNGKEFVECIEAMITDPKMRVELGRNAQRYVEENRLEKYHAKRRLDIYQNLIDNAYRLQVFKPKEKEKVEV